MADLREAIVRLRSQLATEIETEVQHLRDIGGPRGMRNSIGSAMGMAKNDVRSEMIARLTLILDGGDD